MRESGQGLEADTLNDGLSFERLVCELEGLKVVDMVAGLLYPEAGACGCSMDVEEASRVLDVLQSEQEGPGSGELEERST